MINMFDLNILTPQVSVKASSGTNFSQISLSS